MTTTTEIEKRREGEGEEEIHAWLSSLQLLVKQQ